MNDKLWDALVGAIRSVRERSEVAGPWKTWADEVLAGAVTTSVQAIEAATAAGAVMATAGLVVKGTEPPQRIARAAWAIAHAAALAMVYGDDAARAVESVVEIVDREIQSG